MSKAIQSILTQQGWEEIKLILLQETEEQKKEIDVKGKTPQQIGEEYMRIEAATKTIKSAIRKIERHGAFQDKSKQSFV